MDKQFKDLYQILKDDLFRLAYSYTKNTNDAEDILQEVFVKLYNNINALNTMIDIKKWCIRVTINECKDLQKSIWKRKIFTLDDNKKNNFSYVQNNQSKEILACLFSLPTKYRIILFLYYYEGYKTYEIANILNKKETTIRSILSRGREKLKPILKEVDIDE
jgi:RNA polymerase sigma-70 factor (ECF subfamily)